MKKSKLIKHMKDLKGDVVAAIIITDNYEDNGLIRYIENARSLILLQNECEMVKKALDAIQSIAASDIISDLAKGVRKKKEAPKTQYTG